MNDYREIGHGGVRLSAPDGRTVLLQGGDASQLLDEVDEVEAVWASDDLRPDGTFGSMDEHVSMLLEDYFE